MRRPIAIFLGAFMALTAGGLAATPKKGDWARSGGSKMVSTLEFTVKGGKVKNFGGYAYERCDGEPLRIAAFAVDKAMKVRKNGKFSANEKVKMSGATFRTVVKGRFTSRSKAKGTLRYYSVVVGSVCDTYKLKWKAKRG